MGHTVPGGKLLICFLKSYIRQLYVVLFYKCHGRINISNNDELGVSFEQLLLKSDMENIEESNSSKDEERGESDYK